MPTFSYNPSTPAKKIVNPRIKQIRFGNGYEQRAGDGINPILSSWDLVFDVRSDSEAQAIENFLETQGGISSFDWTPPGGSAGKYICKEWSRSYLESLDVNRITAKFEEVAEV